MEEMGCGSAVSEVLIAFSYLEECSIDWVHANL